MTQKQKAEMYAKIEQHGQNLLAIFPDAKERNAIKLCKKLRKLEREAEILAYGLCDGKFDIEECEPHLDIVKNKAIKLLGSPAENWVLINLDPRGYAIKIKSEFCQNRTIFRDWGGYGILAPDFTPNK